MQPYLQQALDALHHAQYAQVFEILQEAKVMNHDLNALQDEFILENLQARYHQRLEVAIKKAFTHSLPHSLTHSNTHFLSHLPSPTSHFIGREAELKMLHENLQAGKRTALVNGLGGVGKTALAQKYAQNYQNDYAHILYIRQSGHLLASFIQREIFDNLHLDFEKQGTELNAFTNLVQALKQLQGTNLLLIDNYEPTDTDKTHDTINQLFALPTAWRVVCTSRFDVPFFANTLRLDVLPAHEAIQVFQQHAVGKPLDDTEIDALLRMIGYHTLMTELLAKTYRESMHFESVGELHAFLQQEALHHQKLQEDIYVGTQETALLMHLQTVFSLASLTEAETWLLKQWAVLPTTPHKGKDFLTWIQDTDLAYEKPLKVLAKKGWLQTDDKLSFLLHPFLQLFLHNELKPTLPDCEKMWLYFAVLMRSKEIEANPLAYQWISVIGEAMVQKIDFITYTEAKSALWNRLDNLYAFLGNYSNAIRCAKEYVTATANTVGKQHQNYAIALNNLAILYNKQGNTTNSLLLHEESLQVRKEVLGERHPQYATSLNNLAILYIDQGNYVKALSFYEEALQIRKEVLGEQHPDYAISLSSLAYLYDKQSNYAKALPLFQKSLQIRKEVLGERHPTTAISLWCIGALYFQQGDYTQARQYLEEAYSIFVEKLGEQHPHTQKTKTWLDDLPPAVQ